MDSFIPEVKMRSSVKSKDRKRTASIKTIRLRKRARVMRFLNAIVEVEDYDDEGSVVDQSGKEEPETIDLCDTDLSVSTFTQSDDTSLISGRRQS
jgi:hypothetical protein